jgi:hypothetical protein
VVPALQQHEAGIGVCRNGRRPASKGTIPSPRTWKTSFGARIPSRLSKLRYIVLAVIATASIRVVTDWLTTICCSLRAQADVATGQRSSAADGHGRQPLQG